MEKAYGLIIDRVVGVVFFVEEEDSSGEPLFGDGVGDEVGAYVKEERFYVFGSKVEEV